MWFSKNQFRLQTDHHSLVLEQFDVKTQTWQTFAEMACERPTEAMLLHWFRQYSALKKASVMLVLSEALFQFQTFPLTEFQLQDSQSKAFMTAVKQKITILENLEDYWLDAIITATECEIALLAKASIEDYLNAFKKAKIKLQAVSVLNKPEFNLLDWRKQKNQTQRFRKALRLLGLPFLTLLIFGSIAYQETSKLAQVKIQNHSLNGQLNLLRSEKAGIPISLGSELLQDLGSVKGVDSIAIHAQGEVDLAGTLAQSDSAEGLLQYLSNLPAFEKNSMQNWLIHESQNSETWQVSFRLKEAG